MCKSTGCDVDPGVVGVDFCWLKILWIFANVFSEISLLTILWIFANPTFVVVEVDAL